MVDRRSDKHSPRIDDELSHDVRSMLQGAPIESRAQEQRLQENGTVLPEDENVNDLRAELASVLRPSSFPGDRNALIRTATQEQAEDRLLSVLRTLPRETRFATFEEAWEKMRPPRQS